MPHRRKNCTVMEVSEVDKFSGTACSIIPGLVVEMFTQRDSIVTKFCRLTLGVPLIMPHRASSIVGIRDASNKIQNIRKAIDS